MSDLESFRISCLTNWEDRTVNRHAALTERRPPAGRSAGRPLLVRT